VEKVHHIRAQVQQADGSQPQQTTTAQSELSISRNAGDSLGDQLGVSTMPDSTTSLLMVGSTTPFDIFDIPFVESDWDDLLKVGLPETRGSGYPPGGLWNYEDGSNSRPANSSQLPNEAAPDLETVFDPTLTDRSHPSSILAFNSSVGAPDREMAQMGDMGLPPGPGRLSSPRIFSRTGHRGPSRPRRRPPRFNGGCDFCLRRGLPCSLPDEGQMPCTMCRQLGQNCIVQPPTSSEERMLYLTSTPVPGAEPPFQREAGSNVSRPDELEGYPAGFVEYVRAEPDYMEDHPLEYPPRTEFASIGSQLQQEESASTYPPSYNRTPYGFNRSDTSPMGRYGYNAPLSEEPGFWPSPSAGLLDYPDMIWHPPPPPREMLPRVTSPSMEPPLRPSPTELGLPPSKAPGGDSATAGTLHSTEHPFYGPPPPFISLYTTPKSIATLDVANRPGTIY
jgi:hypothetical protein